MHESIGTQVKLPFRRALTISVRGIRIRLGRSLVTVSGVVLFVVPPAVDDSLVDAVVVPGVSKSSGGFSACCSK